MIPRNEKLLLKPLELIEDDPALLGSAPVS